MSTITPFLRRLQKSSFITFQQSLEDMNFTFNDSTKKFKFSHFVLLDLPPIQNSSNFENTIQLKNIEGKFTFGNSTATPFPTGDNIDISEAFQNYILNFESLLISNTAYNKELPLNTSERIFFKFLKEVGVLRFRNATTNDYINQTLTDKRFLEEKENSNTSIGDIYKRVVQYVGEVNLEGSNFSSNKNSFKEVYIYVPSQNGNTPKVLFKSVEDENYHSSQVVRKDSNTNIEFINGRDSSDDPTPSGLSAQALYDMDVPLGSYVYLVNNDVLQDIWFDYASTSGLNSYITEQAFNQETNDEIKRTNSTTLEELTYKRSRLDGIMIDFDLNNYTDVVNSNNQISSFGDFSTSSNSKTFGFNTVLLYYDVYDPNNPEDSTTNLYGVCFLNDLEIVSTGASKFKSFSKIKQDNTLNIQGNGFGFRFNFKFDVTNNKINPSIEISVNDYNSFSMQIFEEAMQKMIMMNSRYEDVLLLAKQQNDEIEFLKNILGQNADYNTLRQSVDALNDKIDTLTLGTGFTNLLGKQQDQINAILTGNTRVGLDFFLDLQPSNQLKLDLINNVLYFKNLRQSFEKNKTIELFTDVNLTDTKNNLFEIGTYNNLLIHESEEEKICQDNVTIYLNDGVVGWQNNQKLTFFLKSNINFNNFGIVFYTDSENKFSNPLFYQKLIGALTYEELIGKSIIEIICISNTDYNFILKAY